MALFDFITDHLNPHDRDQFLDKLACIYAEKLAEQQAKEIVHVGLDALAKRMKCSRTTVSKIVADQRIKCVRVGKKGYQFQEADVLEYYKRAA